MSEYVACTATFYVAFHFVARNLVSYDFSPTGLKWSTKTIPSNKYSILYTKKKKLFPHYLQHDKVVAMWF